MKICPKCQIEYDNKFSFCQKCGNKLEIKDEKPICATCGNIVENGGEFCPYCGTPFVANISSDAQQHKNVQDVADNHKNFAEQNKKPKQAETISQGSNNGNKTPFEFKFLIIAIALVIAFFYVVSVSGNDENVRGTAVAPRRSSVMLYSSLPEKQLNAIKIAFEKIHPDIGVDYYFAGAGRVLTKLATEAKSGQVMADIIWVGNPENYVTLKKLGILQKYESPEAKNIDKAFIDPEGFYTGARMMNMGIAYNTTKVKKEEAPKTWNDLLDPKWKGQIVMTDPSTAGITKYTVSALMTSIEYGTTFFEKLKANGTKLQSGTSATHGLIADGSYKVGICCDDITNYMKFNGYPIDFIYLGKDSISVFCPLALIKGAKNEKNAKLLIDFILSKEGQEVLVANNLLSVRKDVKQKGENVEAIVKRTMNVDLQTLAAGSNEALRKFNVIFQRPSNGAKLSNQTVSNEKSLNNNTIPVNYVPVKVLNGTINLPRNFKKIENPSVASSNQGFGSGIALIGEVEKDDSTEKDPRLNRFNVMVMFAKSADLLELKSSEEEAALEATFNSYWERNIKTSKVATKREFISKEFGRTNNGHKYLKVKFISGIPDKPNIDLLHNVGFYIFGDTLYHIDLDTVVRANGKHDKDFEMILSTFDAFSN